MTGGGGEALHMHHNLWGHRTLIRSIDIPKPISNQQILSGILEIVHLSGTRKQNVVSSDIYRVLQTTCNQCETKVLQWYLL